PHSNAYRQVSRFFPGKFTPRLKVICGRDRSGAEAAARQFGWDEVETDWRKVVEREDIDVIDVSTPGDVHPPQAIAAAEAGKHVICEKPLANTLAHAKEMLRAVEKAGVKHMLMHNYRKIPAVAFAKKLIEDGRLGDVYHYHGAYLQDWIMDPNFPLVWRLEKKHAGSGALGDIGSHAADLARYLNAEFDSVTAHMTTIIVTESVHPYVGAWWPPGHIIGYERTFVHAVHDFLTALEKDTLPSPNFADGVKNQAVLDTIERSAKSGKWERIAR